MSLELEELAEDAQRWNALPLLLHILDKDSASLPHDLRSLSRSQYVQNYLSALLYRRELVQLLTMLAERDVDVVVLKGAALSMYVYPTPGLRPMRDVDVLVHREDMAQVAEILSGQGYQRYPPPARNGVEKFQGAITWVKSGEFPIVIDTHWTLGPEYPYSGRIETEGLWSRAVTVNLGSTDTLVLCPEDALMHACLHLFQHWQDFWLVPACDIAALVRYSQGRLDWDSFLQTVIELKLCLPVQYSLKKTYGALHPHIPDSVLEGLNSRKASRHENNLYDLLSWSGSTIGPANLAKLLTIPGVGQKLQYLCSILFPSREWLRDHYPRANTRTLALYVVHIRNVFVLGLRVLSRFASGRKLRGSHISS